MTIIILLLLIFALVCFLIGAAGVGVHRFNMVALGLAFWVITAIIDTAQTIG
jgi:hypothetical protein